MRFCVSNHHLFLLKSNFRYPTIYIYSAKTLLPFSTATSTAQTHFMVDYLIQKCGLSREKANSASKTLTHIKSPENPDSVLDFLKQSGFNDTHIRDLISKKPKLLNVKVENTLKPKFLFFQELGLYGTPFAEITSRYPHFLRYSIENHLQPTITYLRSFFHTNDRIVTAIKRWAKVLSYDLQKRIMPGIEVLRECGIPDHKISSLILR
ncbi:transcription termination factor MTERF4, chloroplastic-like protein [Cinnamomum micranthum f. kanehirae]|uniref:Transcription termination factor MTERF4, chloroplastic-like protein n=1 Tax=Cinnamomum micranthum f. kanehirae TaxID=337451 RepID=A0A3S3ML46_9MAGN|nr:transcription termination factor MTERF4, chloroplastic-like protein [Cinnamomum micranthum f. kanehirae]